MPRAAKRAPASRKVKSVERAARAALGTLATEAEREFRAMMRGGAAPARKVRRAR